MHCASLCFVPPVAAYFFQILKLKLKCSDFHIMRIGLIGMVAAFLILFLKNVGLFFTACIALGFGGLINPSANAIISIYISDKEQGLAQGAFSAVSSLSSLLAQAVFEPMFLLGINQYQNPSFAFYFAFAFCAISVSCCVMFERIFFTEQHDKSTPRYSLPRRAVIFRPSDVVELPQPMTADDSTNRLAFNFRQSHAMEVSARTETLLQPAHWD